MPPLHLANGQFSGESDLADGCFDKKGAGLAIVLGSIRKDGLAVGLLDPSWNSLKVPQMTSGQLLTCVYLGGLLLPCLVTLLTIGREMGFLYAARLAVRQAGWVVFFSLLIAWVL